MANVDNTGFRPAKNLAGNRIVELLFPVNVANATALFVGDVVSAASTGSVEPAAANAGTSAVGVCVAVYDSNKVPCGAPGSSVATKYLAATTAGYALIALATPDAIFIAQGQTGYSYAEADIFATTDHVAGSGSTVTAKSGHELNLNDKNSGAQFLILGKVEEPNNVVGVNCALYVQFHESLFGQVDKSVGV